MLLNLPRSLQTHIYEYDPTYRAKYHICMLELRFHYLVALDVTNIYLKLNRERETFYAYLEFLKNST